MTWVNGNVSAATLYVIVSLENALGFVRMDHNTSNGGAYLYTSDGSNHYIGPTNTANGTWFHLAATISGTTHTFYVNGVSNGVWVGTPNSSGSGINAVGARRLDSSQFYYKGSQDDFRLYKSVLTPTQILEIYTNTDKGDGSDENGY